MMKTSPLLTHFLVTQLLLLSAISPSLAADKFLADRHIERLSGNCQVCHLKTTAPVQTAMCLSCHTSFEQLAKRTSKKDINPHETHLGESDCKVCHRAHQASILVCDECHQFADIKVP